MAEAINPNWLEDYQKRLQLSDCEASESVEYPVSTLDGATTIDIPMHPDYPVAFELLTEPEPWQATVERHRRERGTEAIND